VEYRIKLTPDMEKFTCRGEQEVDLEVHTQDCVRIRILFFYGILGPVAFPHRAQQW